jgi:hypothetical protein
MKISWSCFRGTTQPQYARTRACRQLTESLSNKTKDRRISDSTVTNGRGLVFEAEYVPDQDQDLLACFIKAHLLCQISDLHDERCKCVSKSCVTL